MFKFEKIYKLCSAFEKLTRNGLFKLAQKSFENIEFEKLNINPKTFKFENLQPLAIETPNSLNIIETLDKFIGLIKSGNIFIFKLKNTKFFVDAEAADEVQTSINNFLRKYRDDQDFDFFSKKNVTEHGFYYINLNEIFEFLESFDPQERIIYDEDITDEVKDNPYWELDELKEEIKSYLVQEGTVLNFDLLANKFDGITANNYFDKLYYYIDNKKVFLFTDSSFSASLKPYLAYEFAKKFPGADVSELQKAVIKDLDFAYLFAKDVPGANVSELQKAVVKSDSDRAYYFAKDVPGANIEELQEVLMQDPDLNYHLAYEFAKDVRGADVAKLQKIIIDSPQYVYRFARDVPGANIEELQKAVINDPKWAYHFAEDVHEADIQYIYDNIKDEYYRKKLEELAKNEGIELN